MDNKGHRFTTPVCCVAAVPVVQNDDGTTMAQSRVGVCGHTFRGNCKCEVAEIHIKMLTAGHLR